jgi:hypothetical protein
MANTYKQMYIQFVFAVQNRVSLIQTTWKDELYKYITGIVQNNKHWINKKGFIKGKFIWQESYGAFSYSHSHIDRVVKYIINQEQHHKKKTFREEYIELLNRFNIDYDERYILKDIQ